MHCKPCEICPAGYVCRRADEPDSKCPISGATEADTVKCNYEEE